MELWSARCFRPGQKYELSIFTGFPADEFTLRELYYLPWLSILNATTCCEEKNNRCICSWWSRYKKFVQYLHNPDIILYPGYEALDLEDFARFGHLPVYPLGMITNYGTRADGAIESPAGFYGHDISHISDNPIHKHLDGSAPLHSPRSRLNYRQSMLDKTASVLERHGGNLKKVVVYGIFDVFHEFGHKWEEGKTILDSDSFLRLFWSLKILRKRTLYMYPPDYYDLTDEDAWQGCLLVHRLHQYWISEGAEVLTEDEIEHFYSATFHPCADALSTHMKIISDHKELFLSWFKLQIRKNANGLLSSYDGFKSVYCDFTHQLYVSGVSCFRYGSPAYSNADIIYLELIRNPVIKKEIEQALGACIPEMCKF